MVVRMRHTRGHTSNRRSHHKLAKPALSKDGSGNVHLRHRMTITSGSYRGKKIVDMTSEIEKKTAKTKEKESAR